MMKLDDVMSKAEDYNKVLANTISYRKDWNNGLKKLITDTLKTILKKTKINGEIVDNDQIVNLASIVLDLGRSSSGIEETVENTDIKRTMIKSNGQLVYQQLFNGKVMVMMALPHVEGYGDPKPPVPMEILRPYEVSQESIVRNVESFLTEITRWEDYDDDKVEQKQPFNPIGFQTEPTEAQ